MAGITIQKYDAATYTYLELDPGRYVIDSLASQTFVWADSVKTEQVRVAIAALNVQYVLNVDVGGFFGFSAAGTVVIKQVGNSDGGWGLWRSGT